MSKFQNAMSKKPPHVFVEYKRGATREQDQYAYGIVGSMPHSQLIGFLVRVQAELAFRNPDPCDESKCVIAFDPQTHKFSWFVDSSIPVDALVGTLELIKATLVDVKMQQLFQQSAERAKTGLVTADGRPILKG